jgi:hypothetical protein
MGIYAKNLDDFGLCLHTGTKNTQSKALNSNSDDDLNIQLEA